MSRAQDSMDNDTLATYEFIVGDGIVSQEEQWEVSQEEQWEQILRQSEKPGENFDPFYSTIGEELVRAGAATRIVVLAA